MWDLPWFELPMWDLPWFELPVWDLPWFELPVWDLPWFELPMWDLPWFELPKNKAGEGFVSVKARCRKDVLTIILSSKQDCIKLS